MAKEYSKTIIAHVPVTNGQVQETGDFELDGVIFPAAEVQIEFLDLLMMVKRGDMFPTGNVVDQLLCLMLEHSKRHLLTQVFQLFS